MRSHFAMIRLLPIILVICPSQNSLCYATQCQLGEAQASHDIIVTQYNSATRTTRSLIQGVPIPISETAEFNHLYVNAAVDYPGREPRAPETVKIGFGSRPCHISDNSETEVTIRTDNRLAFSGKLQRLACSGGIGRESEFGIVEVSFDEFVEIAEAREVQVRIGEHEFVLSDDAKRGFQRLINFVRGVQGIALAPNAA